MFWRTKRVLCFTAKPPTQVSSQVGLCKWMIETSLVLVGWCRWVLIDQYSLALVGWYSWALFHPVESRELWLVELWLSSVWFQTQNQESWQMFLSGERKGDWATVHPGTNNRNWFSLIVERAVLWYSSFWEHNYRSFPQLGPPGSVLTLRASVSLKVSIFCLPGSLVPSYHTNSFCFSPFKPTFFPLDGESKCLFLKATSCLTCYMRKKMGKTKSTWIEKCPSLKQKDTTNLTCKSNPCISDM